jgi:hypothetical protein
MHRVCVLLVDVLLGAQGGGVFCNPRSPSAPAKLRLLYECAPLALIVEVRETLRCFACKQHSPAQFPVCALQGLEGA